MKTSVDENKVCGGWHLVSCFSTSIEYEHRSLDSSNYSIVLARAVLNDTFYYFQHLNILTLCKEKAIMTIRMITVMLTPLVIKSITITSMSHLSLLYSY
jgi:hypothetical protein